jgi:hypothetical protein
MEDIIRQSLPCFQNLKPTSLPFPPSSFSSLFLLLPLPFPPQASMHKFFWQLEVMKERALIFRALGERDLARSMDSHIRGMMQVQQLKRTGLSGWEAWRNFFVEARSESRRQVTRRAMERKVELGLWRQVPVEVEALDGSQREYEVESQRSRQWNVPAGVLLESPPITPVLWRLREEQLRQEVRLALAQDRLEGQRQANGSEIHEHEQSPKEALEGQSPVDVEKL